MQAIRMVMVTLGLAVTGVLFLALVTHVAAWIRRRPIGQVHVATTRVGGPAAHGQQGLARK